MSIKKKDKTFYNALSFFMFAYFFLNGSATITPATISTSQIRIKLPQPTLDTALAKSVEEADAAM